MNVGGQAVLEGVMMRTAVVVVRRGAPPRRRRRACVSNPVTQPRVVAAAGCACP